MFSHIYSIWEMAARLCLQVEGKMVRRTKGNIDDSLSGGNASSEDLKGTVITGVGLGVVMNNHLQKTSFTKEIYRKFLKALIKKYIEDYMKSIKGKCEESRQKRVKPFMTEAAEQIKHVLANFKHYQLFIVENMNPDAMAVRRNYV
ncbi:translationally-controlled tumor protein-like [Pteronotus mesoamericanus]|uniref:translationally-controlled tumor protein-like n=1 Tax=Pteronotus mesoamericanus TaxID=1884717 RepID=UPI0023ED6E25|nr:translationally-controlled tumor protein-like [Pteronotus parnellii mesoamericanus]